MKDACLICTAFVLKACIALQAAQMGVARMLAPNGQPRKMPAALLQSGDTEALQHFESLEEATPEELKHGWTIGAASQTLLSMQRTSLRS